MKGIKMWFVGVCAAAILLGANVGLADQSCCVKAKVKGKDCAHPCCVEAHKAGKLCDHCQKKPTCCDKALAAGKECAHPCCVAAAKEKKLCEKCNSPAKKAQ